MRELTSIERVLESGRKSATFLVWKTRFKTEVSSGSDFPSETVFFVKEVEMVDSLDELKILAISLWRGFSKLRDAGREDCLGCEQDHPDFPVQEEGQPRGAESPKKRTGFHEEDRSPS